MNDIEYFEIGKIVNTQGIRGDVRVLPTTDEPERFSKLKKVLLDDSKSMTEYDIENVWFHKGFVIIKFKEILDMNAAEKLKGISIKIDRKDALPLKDGEYYISDLYDMDVYTDENKYLGIIKDIIFTAANDVYVVENPESEDKKNILIPVIKQCILDINIDEHKMIIHMMEGLADL